MDFHSSCIASVPRKMRASACIGYYIPNITLRCREIQNLIGISLLTSHQRDIYLEAAAKSYLPIFMVNQPSPTPRVPHLGNFHPQHIPLEHHASWDSRICGMWLTCSMSIGEILQDLVQSHHDPGERPAGLPQVLSRGTLSSYWLATYNVTEAGLGFRHGPDL